MPWKFIETIREVFPLQSTFWFVTCSFLVGGVVFGGVGWLVDSLYKKNLAEKNQPKFSVAIESLLGDSSPKLFWVRKPDNRVCTAQIGAYVAITNLQVRASMLAQLKFEIRGNDGNWYPIHTAETDGVVYFGADKRKVYPIEPLGGFLIPSSSNFNLPAGSTLRGLALWNFPEVPSTGLSIAALRARITEMSGVKHVISMEVLESSSQRVGFTATGTFRDISDLADSPCEDFNF